tara:strand:+ start:453 stop:746 length:294 start_codon:yes stop_codon:yes gene_type:complete
VAGRSAVAQRVVAAKVVVKEAGERAAVRVASLVVARAAADWAAAMVASVAVTRGSRRAPEATRAAKSAAEAGARPAATGCSWSKSGAARWKKLWLRD